jgi:hypothetical protein
MKINLRRRRHQAHVLILGPTGVLPFREVVGGGVRQIQNDVPGAKLFSAPRSRTTWVRKHLGVLPPSPCHHQPELRAWSISQPVNFKFTIRSLTCINKPRNLPKSRHKTRKIATALSTLVHLFQVTVYEGSESPLAPRGLCGVMLKPWTLKRRSLR